jgi:hypothetical protein
MQLNTIKTTNLTKYDDCEGQHAFESKRWSCTISGKTVPLVLLMEVLNMEEITGEEEFQDYPYLVSVSLMVARPHKSFYDGEGKPSKSELLYYCHQYMGGVPFDHELIRIDSLNNNIMGELKAKQAKIKTTKHDYGTIAAQEGKGSSFSYPMFKDSESAYEFGKQLIEAYGDTLLGLVGFILDKPINLVGETGWGVLKKQLKGVK